MVSMMIVNSHVCTGVPLLETSLQHPEHHDLDSIITDDGDESSSKKRVFCIYAPLLGLLLGFVTQCADLAGQLLLVSKLMAQCSFRDVIVIGTIWSFTTSTMTWGIIMLLCHLFRTAVTNDEHLQLILEQRVMGGALMGVSVGYTLIDVLLLKNWWVGMLTSVIMLTVYAICMVFCNFRRPKQPGDGDCNYIIMETV
jgi:hypothetical protein